MKLSSNEKTHIALQGMQTSGVKMLDRTQINGRKKTSFLYLETVTLTFDKMDPYTIPSKLSICTAFTPRFDVNMMIETRVIGSGDPQFDNRPPGCPTTYTILIDSCL